MGLAKLADVINQASLTQPILNKGWPNGQIYRPNGGVDGPKRLGKLAKWKKKRRRRRRRRIS